MRHKRNPSKATLPAPDAARVQGGKMLITIQGVPVDDIERLMEAILDGFQPKRVRAV